MAVGSEPEAGRHPVCCSRHTWWEALAEDAEAQVDAKKAKIDLYPPAHPPRLILGGN